MSNQSPVAGWYPDPSDPSLLRYWDGMAWTSSTQPAAPAGPGLAGVPPYQPGVAGGSPYQPGPPLLVGYGAGHPGFDRSGLGDIGSWLSRTFTVITDRLVAVLVLLYALPTVGYVLALILAVGAVSNVEFRARGDVVTGLDVGLLVLAGAAFALTLLLLAISYLAGAHQLHAGHLGRRAEIAESLAVALRRLPRFLAYGLLLGLGASALFLVAFIAPIALAVSADQAGPAILLVVTIPLVLVGTVWLWVRLSLFGVAAAVAPSGVNPISASWNATGNRFWAVLGRLLVLLAIVYMAQGVAQFALQIVLTPVIGSSTGFEIDSVTGQVAIDGVDIEDLDVVRIRDLLPNVGVLVALVAIYNAIQAAAQAINLSGAAGLYARLGGPHPDGPG